MFGMLRSMKINLGRHAIANSKASAPSTAEITGQPRNRSVMTRSSRQSVSSSTTKIKFLFSVTRPFSKLFSQAEGVAADLSLQPIIVYSARSNTLGCLSGFALLALLKMLMH